MSELVKSAAVGLQLVKNKRWAEARITELECQLGLMSDV